MPEQTIAELFYQDLKKSTDLLRGHLVAFKATPYAKSILEAVQHDLLGIKGGAKIMHVKPLLELIRAFEDFLTFASNGHAQLLHDKASLLNEVLEALENLCEGDWRCMQARLTEQTNHLVALTKRLQDFQSTDDLGKWIFAGQQEALYDKTLLDLFAVELETQLNALNQGLVAFERGQRDLQELQPLMRAAHSIKGAARVVRLDAVVQLAHAMEDCIAAAQNKTIFLQEEGAELLFQCIDCLKTLFPVTPSNISAWLTQETEHVDQLTQAIAQMLQGKRPKVSEEAKASTQTKRSEALSTQISAPTNNPDRVLRVTAQSLNRLMALAGESLVESRWLHPFGEALTKLKREQQQLVVLLDQMRNVLNEKKLSEDAAELLSELRRKLNHSCRGLTERSTEFEMYIRRQSSLSGRLYTEVLDSRMRPFADGVTAFPRMVRDLARQLKKKVHFEIVGENTPVDREILEKLEAPLHHLLRNAVDHGIETPQERKAAGKPEEGRLRLEAQHRAGMLAITVSDDGRGIHIEDLRERIVRKKLTSSEMAKEMSENELLDFLFLPGFSTASQVTEISGRGVGLSVLQNMVQEVGGTIHITFKKGHGTSFHLQLPLTLSVTRAMLVQIAGEPYAFPLTRISKVLNIPVEEIQVVENRQYISSGGTNIGLVSAAQVLGYPGHLHQNKWLSIVVLNDFSSSYGVIVDKFLGEKEFVVQELEPLLGKVSDISAGTYMENGDPILIIDVDDMMRSIDKLLSSGNLQRVSEGKGPAPVKKKRILVVDDSITVREVECRLLQNQGYEVDTAINGIDGWNAVRVGNYNLVVTDVDMPRMNGIEFVRAIKSDSRLKSIPVMIVSYKEREEDRLLGLEAGANYYLTKSSFHDESLLNAVHDLIGRP